MVRKICLDSDVAIDFLKGKTDIKEKLENLEAEFFMTSISIFEIWTGRFEKEEKLIESLFDSAHKKDFSSEAALKAADIHRELRKKGDLIEFRDIFIAAICITEDLELLTNNKKHFLKIKNFGLKIAE